MRSAPHLRKTFVEGGRPLPLSEKPSRSFLHLTEAWSGRSACVWGTGRFGGGSTVGRGLSGPWKRCSLKRSRTKPSGGAGLLRTGIAIVLPTKPSVRRRRGGGSALRGDDAAARAGGRNGQDRPLPHGRTSCRRLSEVARTGEANRRRRRSFWGIVADNCRIKCVRCCRTCFSPVAGKNGAAFLFYCYIEMLMKQGQKAPAKFGQKCGRLSSALRINT